MRIAIPDFVSSTFFPLIVAKALNIFDDEGQDVEAKSLTENKQGENGGRGIPKEAVSEINKAGDVFPKIEVWRKQRIDKDPIAVGVIGDSRYLIARWGEDKLIPFDRIKKNVPMMYAWKYATHPVSKLMFVAGAGLISWLSLLN